MVLLIGVPVMAGVIVAQIHHNALPEGEQAARTSLGDADAELQVTRYPEVALAYRVGDELAAHPLVFTSDSSGGHRPVLRNPAAVDLAALLPADAELTPAPVDRTMKLGSGGQAAVLFLDLTSPMAAGLASVTDGRAPQASDEAGVSRAMAEEFSLVDSHGGIRAGAMIELGGRQLAVTGILGDDEAFGATTGPARVLLPPDSLLAGNPTASYLVDLPNTSTEAVSSLVTSMAAAGVAMKPRDLYFHPGRWGAILPEPARADARSGALGLLVVAGGMVEVVVVVGSAFAVGARRRMRELGALASIGAAPSDLRRVLLAQGLLFGLGGSATGAVLGLAGFHAVLPIYERISHHHLWNSQVDWLSLAGIFLLGASTGMIAAILPARRIARMSPLTAIRGVPESTPARRRRGMPPVIAIGLGTTLLIAYILTNVASGKRQESTVVTVVGGAGALILLLGLTASIPFLFDRISAIARLLPLSGRYATRYAARHRMRSWGGAATLMATVGAAVLASFPIQSAVAAASSDESTPRHSVLVTVNSLAGEHFRRADAQRLAATVRGVLGDVRDYQFARAAGPPGRRTQVELVGGRDGYTDLSVISPRTLRFLTGGVDHSVMQMFKGGGVVVNYQGAIRSGTATIALYPRLRSPHLHWHVPAEAVTVQFDSGAFDRAWVSPATARALGLRITPMTSLFLADRQVTTDDVARLAVHGIHAGSRDIEDASARRIQVWTVLGVAVITLLVLTLIIGLTSAEGRTDSTTLAAVGASPRTRLLIGTLYACLIAAVGSIFGCAFGLAVGVALLRVGGTSPGDIPWTYAFACLVGVPALAAGVGALGSNARATMVRRLS